MAPPSSRPAQPHTKPHGRAPEKQRKGRQRPKHSRQNGKRGARNVIIHRQPRIECEHGDKMRGPDIHPEAQAQRHEPKKAAHATEHAGTAQYDHDRVGPGEAEQQCQPNQDQVELARPQQQTWQIESAHLTILPRRRHNHTLFCGKLFKIILADGRSYLLPFMATNPHGTLKVGRKPADFSFMARPTVPPPPFITPAEHQINGSKYAKNRQLGVNKKLTVSCKVCSKVKYISAACPP